MVLAQDHLVRAVKLLDTNETPDWVKKAEGRMTGG
jgi:hypothetical protein